MILGITGSRVGITAAQEAVFKQLWRTLEPSELHHGDCIGADEAVHNLSFVQAMGNIILHPCTIEKYRAYCASHQVFPLLPPLDRNKVIVDTSDIMIAFPNENTPVLRSGTWATIRECYKSETPVYIIFPNGEFVKR